MPQTADQRRAAARRRQANKRARDKGMPEPYPSEPSGLVVGEEIQYRDERHASDLEWAEALDATGNFYKSECRSAITLLQIYEGGGVQVISEEDEEVVDKVTGKKRQNLPVPSIQAIRIRAIEHEGHKIEPDERDYKKVFEQDGVASFQRWLDLRDKARKDLFWLARLLGCNFFHATHQIMCDMFVKKNFDGMYFPGFDRDDIHEGMIGKQTRVASDGVTPTRTMLLFAPRSSYKSTADGVDTVQWMLNCPDIRILIMTSVKRLSKELMTEIKRYFYLPPRGVPSPFQMLFPEYVLTGVDGRSKEPIVCPAQNFSTKEPHVWVTSLDSSFVGSRCDIRKLDDIVEDKNSSDEELRASLDLKVKATNALVEPWGFTDVIGTRYFTVDWYGTRMAKDEDGNDPEPFAYLSISAWIPKLGRELEYERLIQEPNGVFRVTPDMVDLFFPYKLHWAALQTKLREYKERGFKNQYLNVATDPIETSDFAVHFTREELRAHTYAESAAPQTGESLVCIDWAYTADSKSDSSVLAAIRRHTRDDNTQELIVREIDHDKWKADVLALKIVMFLRKHRPQRTLIEEANGADLLLLALKVQASRLGCLEVLNSIRWVPIDNSPNAKGNRVKGLEILLADNRLHFCSGPWIDALYKQFEQFTGEVRKGRKDDIPDAISIATRALPSNTFTHIKVDPEEEKKAQERAEREWKKRAQYDRMFSDHQQNYQAPTWREALRGPEAPAPAEPIAPPKPPDPRMKVFGNKGPWRL